MSAGPSCCGLGGGLLVQGLNTIPAGAPPTLMAQPGRPVAVLTGVTVLWLLPM